MLLSSGLIVFREALEIVIILTILAGATKNIPHRNHYMLLGVAIGTVGSAMLGFVSDDIDSYFGGVGQEVLNGVMLIITAIMIGFTVIWMTKNGRKSGSKLKEVVAEIESGSKKPYHLVSLVALLMLREGSEIVLYVSSLMIVAKHSILSILFASVCGALAAVMAGLIAYNTANQFVKKNIFTVSNWLMIFIAAGLANQGVGFLIAADQLPEVISSLWNVNSFLPDAALFFIRSFLGNITNPSFTEMLTFVIVIATMSTAYKRAVNAK
ncbi:MAG: FTR1 family protein [Alphaproteobacteria bacterium]|nr:FTR1 family protein [Alphaproteobacteria bacterium]